MDCIFCKICQGEVPADIIYEDDLVVAFKDLAPQAPQHYLIIPRKHISTLNDMTIGDEHILGRIARAGKIIASQLDIAEQGYRLVMNCNTDGGQTVFHIHTHMLGGRQMTWPPG